MKDVRESMVMWSVWLEKITGRQKPETGFPGETLTLIIPLRGATRVSAMLSLTVGSTEGCDVTEVPSLENYYAVLFDLFC